MESLVHQRIRCSKPCHRYNNVCSFSITISKQEWFWAISPFWDTWPCDPSIEHLFHYVLSLSKLPEISETITHLRSINLDLWWMMTWTSLFMSKVSLPALSTARKIHTVVGRTSTHNFAFWFDFDLLVSAPFFSFFFIIHFHEHNMVWYNISSVHNFIQIIYKIKQIYWMHS